MNHDCNGDEFERHGKRYARCLMAGALFVLPAERMELCPECQRPWRPRSTSHWSADASEDVAIEIDLPFYRAQAERQRAALEAVLLFYSPPPWDDAKRDRWKELTGSGECTSKSLCDAVRKALGQ